MTVVDDVKGRLDILELVAGYVTLQKSGNSHKANCPFHQEKTPSFYVFPDRQTWRCFGACATGGDVFSFVMKAANLEFGDALKQLAQQAGVPLPTRERRGEQQSLLQINEASDLFFRQLLVSTQGTSALKYLESRGISQESIETFELGLSPRVGTSLSNHLVKQGFSVDQLVQAGVVRQNGNGQHSDLFRGRLMIPIRNAQSELVGFGSRAMDDSKPKYLNSPRTAIFDKGRILYGLHLAKDSARQHGMVIVEGYMDTITAHQHGFNNVVASMGTALTEYQVDQVRRLTSKVTMALDPDAAGQQATLRSLESSWQVFQTNVSSKAKGTTLFQRQDMPELKIAALPDGLDPDELIRRSTDEWANLVTNGSPLLEYLFTALSSQIDLTTPHGKAKAVEILFPLIAAVSEPTEQDHYFQKLADHLDVGPDTLRASVGRFTIPRRNSQRTAAPRPAVTASAFAKMNRDPIEEYCLSLILQYPDLLNVQGDLRSQYFKRLENREIFDGLSNNHGIERDDDSRFVNFQPELAEQAENLRAKQLPPMDAHTRLAAFQDTVYRLEERYLREVKIEEGIIFSEDSSESCEESYDEILSINQRLRNNETTRNMIAQNPSISR